MEKQYYSPDLEDLFIGYELEYLFVTTPMTKLWKPFKIENSFDFNEIWDVFNEGKSTNIRTPYLSKEDIEKEGWEFYPKGYNNFLERALSKSEWERAEEYNYDTNSFPFELWFKRGDYYLALYRSTSKLLIVKKLDTPNLIFKGKCPSVNEFRKVIKLLEIK